MSGWSIEEALDKTDTKEALSQTATSQPLIFSVQVALAHVWHKWGLRPSAVVGHSLGEISAACVSGALSLPDAVAVIYHRSRLQQTCHGTGGMLFLPMTEKEFRKNQGDAFPGISVAACNSPTSITVSGPLDELELLSDRLAFMGLDSTRLDVEYAFHSSQMEPLRDP